MGLNTTGRIHKVFETEQKTERFRLREFVIELSDNPQYPQHVKFQMTGDRCEALDGFEVGDDVELEFSLRGREWTNREGKVLFFNSLDVWTLKKTGSSAGASSQPPRDDPPPPPPSDDDDIPF